MQHARYFGSGLQPFGQGQRGCFMLLQANVQCAQAALREVDVIGSGGEAEIAMRVTELLQVFVVCRDRAHHRIGMANDIFGRCHNRNVDLMVEGVEEEGRRPGIVHDDCCIVGMCTCCNGWHVLDFKGQGSRAFGEHGFGVGTEQLVDAAADEWIEVGCGHSKARQSLVAESTRRPVDTVGHEKVVACRNGAENGERASLQAGRTEDGSGSTFKVADGGLQCLYRGCQASAVGVGLALVLERVDGSVQDRGCMVDGRVNGAVVVKRRASGVDYPCRSLVGAVRGFGHVAGVSLM